MKASAAHAASCRPCLKPNRSRARPFVAMCAQSFQGCASPLPQKVKVVGMGSCGVDYLASIAAYPKPDEKLRTEKLEVQGGGNCANALTAAARLGLSPTIITKIGGDGLGDGIISELKADGVDTAHVLRAAGHTSPFTYIIVDRSGGTRTCIHTPGANLEPSEVNSALLEDALKDTALVYFDGRLTEAALVVAHAARSKGIPVLVEAERLRPNLEKLLALADYVVTSAHFPQDWTGEADISDAVLAVAERLPMAQLVLTTLGTKGSILLQRPTTSDQSASAPTHPLEEVMSQLTSSLHHQANSSSSEPVCMSRTSVAITFGNVAETAGPIHLQYSKHRNPELASKAAGDAAARAAALNAESGASGRYAMTAVLAPPAPGVLAKVYMASIAGLPRESVIDTTGAGDSFIGSVLYGLVTGMSLPRMLQLAAVVAACKCTELGARPGLPHRSNLSADIL